MIINVLIAKAQKPLPSAIKLPNGNMQFLVAIVITNEEMQWSMKNGRDALLNKLIDAGVEQISDRKRW
ncbi:suppressor of fused domain protein [Acinetobacter bereziniae]|uniref:suppressor of fused domain protein n=1 Tax=Acinetobacter bereziniae TaxID=106648 RepID=UPI0005AA53AD|nr:suppressor of fused domain protein [Acinetobacter bereziniae]